MFDIPWFLIGLFIIWGVFFYASLTKKHRAAQDLALRIFSWLGVVLMAGSILQPWIRFDASEYIGNAVWGVAKEIAPDILTWFGVKGPAKLIDLVLNEATMNAITTSTVLVVVLKTQVWVIWGLYFLIVASSLLLLVATVSHQIACKKWVDILLVLMTLPLFIAMARFMPVLDRLGDHPNLGVAIVGALLGAHIGNGPMIALIGMAVIIFNSLRIILDHTPLCTDIIQTDGG